MNRDYNAAMNIRQNLLHYIEHGCWAERFTRSSKTTNQDLIDADPLYSGNILIEVRRRQQ